MHRIHIETCMETNPNRFLTVIMFFFVDLSVVDNVVSHNPTSVL